MLFLCYTPWVTGTQPWTLNFKVQSLNYISVKDRPRHFAKLPNMEDTFCGPIPRLISCAGVTGRRGLHVCQTYTVQVSTRIWQPMTCMHQEMPRSYETHCSYDLYHSALHRTWVAMYWSYRKVTLWEMLVPSCSLVWSNLFSRLEQCVGSSLHSHTS